MRHRKGRTRLGRTSKHYEATVGNMLTSLIEHGRIRTTQTKARELRRVAERAVTRATRLGDILLKDWKGLEPADRGRLIHAIRMTRRQVHSREAVLRLFNEWAPRYLGRPGGYTRLFKLGYRRGDNAPLALIEFVPAEMPQRESSSTDRTAEQAKPTKRRLFGRNA